MAFRNYKTEAPYAVTTKRGEFKSAHYCSLTAIAAAKSTKEYRIIHGRHRGDWKQLVHFEKGIRVCLPAK